MLTLSFAAVGALVSFFIGAGLGYNTGRAECASQLEQARAERRRARNLTISARVASGTY